MALAGVLVYRVVRAALDDQAAAITWALFTFTPPVPIYAVTIYPETPAVVATAYLLWMARGRPGWRQAIGAAAAAGALAWLHSKFVPLGALGLGFTLLRPCAWRVRAVAVAVFAAMVGGVLWYFHAFYGLASLYAAIGPADLDLRRLPRNVAALFFDRQFGLFAFAPVWLMALPGAPLLLRSRPADAIRALALAACPSRPVPPTSDGGEGRRLPRVTSCPPSPRSLFSPLPPSGHDRRSRPSWAPVAWCSSRWPRTRRGSCTTVRTGRACCCGTSLRPWTWIRSFRRSWSAARRRRCSP